MLTVAAIVVTFNRKELLSQCLDAILTQTKQPDQIFVIDNASTDGTPEHLQSHQYLDNPLINYIPLPKNTGGAGGFYTGMKTAYEAGYDWLWLMDDDVVCAPTALEKILDITHSPKNLQQPTILTSKVLWKDGQIHGMNRPRFYTDRYGEFVQSASQGLLLLRSASFVSCAVHRQAVDKYGFPHPYYFIWNDDSEYTARILKTETGYLVPDSEVCHHTENLCHSIAERAGDRWYFHIRNTLFMLKTNSWNLAEKVKLCLELIRDTPVYLKVNSYSLHCFQLIAKAIIDGIFFENKIKNKFQ
jgi:GT2 family glycosyltransferase